MNTLRSTRYLIQPGRLQFTHLSLVGVLGMNVEVKPSPPCFPIGIFQLYSHTSQGIRSGTLGMVSAGAAGHEEEVYTLPRGQGGLVAADQGTP
jgi:hypothetical protein